MDRFNTHDTDDRPYGRATSQAEADRRHDEADRENREILADRLDTWRGDVEDMELPIDEAGSVAWVLDLVAAKVRDGSLDGWVAKLMREKV